MNDSSLIELRGLRKTFPGVVALDDVDFTLRAGEVHALMGENGAGKSTLIKVLTGVYRKDGGTMKLKGESIAPGKPIDAQRLGISTVYQEVNLVPELTVAENLSIGDEPRRFGMLQWGEITRRAKAAMARLDVEVDVNQPLSSYSVAIQQLVAIARAIRQEASVLILDEPTASLDQDEVEQLFTVIRSLREQGLGIVFVSHFLDQVYAISDRMTVLRNGQLVGSYETADLPRLELISKMLGRSLDEVTQMSEHVHERADEIGDRPVLLGVDGLGKRHAVDRLNFDVKSGEIVGLAGLLGSGRTETACLIFGIDKPETGTITWDGKAIDRFGPKSSILRGMALAPEDRKAEGIVADLSIRENIMLGLQGRRGWLRLLSRAKQKELAEYYVKTLEIKTPDIEKPVGQLSGGNQQKVILGRWLAINPKLLLLDEPTRGIDVGTRAEIEKLIVALADKGMSVIVISSEMDEIVRVSQRLVVLRDRVQIGQLTGADINESAVMDLIAAPPTPHTPHPPHPPHTPSASPDTKTKTEATDA